MAISSAVRTIVKKTRKVISEGKKEEAQTALKETSKALLSSVSKGVLHKNSAARKQSRLALQVNKLGK
jgi:small subunit ribosomal protein S20